MKWEMEKTKINKPKPEEKQSEMEKIAPHAKLRT